MDAGTVIYARLNGQTSASERCHPLFLPQGVAYPCVSYFQVSATQSHAMGQDGPMVRVRMQVDSWADTYAGARTLANEVRGRLSRWSGTVGDVVVLDVFLDNETELYESDTQTRRVTQDYSMWVSS